MSTLVCSGCERDLHDIDHYCAACGKPNTDGRLFPRFEPGTIKRPLLPERPDPGPGEFACPRCEWPTTSGLAWCRQCGMDLERAALAAQHTATTGLWRTPGPHGIDPYRSLDRPCGLVRSLATFAGLAALVTVLLELIRLATLDSEAVDVAGGVAGWSSLASTTTFVALGLTLVFTILWLNRAVRNLAALSVRKVRFAPVPAVVGWFVPVLNLWWPRAVVEDLWWRSSPTAWPLGSRPERERPPISLPLWWPAIVLGTVMAVIAGLAEPAGSAGAFDTWRVVLAIAAGGWVLLAAGLFSLAVAVVAISDRQEQRADRLGEPDFLRRRRRDVGDGPDAIDEAAALLDAEARALAAQAAGRKTTWGRY